MISNVVTKAVRETMNGYADLILEITNIVISSANAGLDSVDSTLLLDMASRHQSRMSGIAREILSDIKTEEGKS